MRGTVEISCSLVPTILMYPEHAWTKIAFPKKEKPNAYMKYGNIKEDRALNMFTEQTGLKVVRVGFFRSEEYDWLGGSPDGLCTDGSLVEIKTCGRTVIKNSVKPSHYYQVQALLAVFQLEQCYLVEYQQLEKGREEIDIKVIKRDHKEWANSIKPALQKFAERVRRGKIITEKESTNGGLFEFA